jgi:aspartyl-tRNA(Asn)/glutamyl-tRNA(Gln) amidotransferase subunit A
LPATEYLRRQRLLHRLRAAADARLAAFDVVICPSSPMSPPLLDRLSEPETYRKISRLAVRNMSFVNLLDLCALTMPVGLDAAGMPVGLQLIARRQADETLLAAATAFEAVLGTAAQRLGTAPLLRLTQGTSR